MAERDAGSNKDPPGIVAPADIEFEIIDTKLYVPVVTLSAESDKRLLEQLKSRFKRIVKWINVDHKRLFSLKITT